jgi:hypothetical protein
MAQSCAPVHLLVLSYLRAFQAVTTAVSRRQCRSAKKSGTEPHCRLIGNGNALSKNIAWEWIGGTQVLLRVRPPKVDVLGAASSALGNERRLQCTSELK